MVADGHLDLIRHKTGLVADPYFSASKLEWMFTEGGVERSDDLAVGTIDSWLLWNLTGGAVHATDDTNASRTMLYDLASGDWSDELCNLFGVPRAALPGWGLPEGTPISGIAGDQQASLFGQACFEPGMTKNTYGTGSFVLMNVGTERPDAVEGLITTTAWSLPDGAGGRRVTYALEGSIFVTGAGIQWLRDGLGIIDEAAEVGSLAESVSDTDGVVVVPAFTGLGSPWWDPYARGRRHDKRLRHPVGGAPGGRWRFGGRPPGPHPGRPARCAGATLTRTRDHRPGRRISRRTGRRFLGLTRRRGRSMGERRHLRGRWRRHCHRGELSALAGSGGTVPRVGSTNRLSPTAN